MLQQSCLVPARRSSIRRLRSNVSDLMEAEAALGRAGAPWTDQAVMEWLNSVLLELYRTGGLRKGLDLREQPSNGQAVVQAKS